MQHNDNALHFSKLKNIADSPFHFKFFEDDERDDTDDFVTGRAVHRGWLLGEKLTAWKGKRQGAEYRQAVEENDGDSLLTETMLANAELMVSALLGSYDANRLLLHAPNRETPMVWTRRGIKCAGRSDAYGKDVLIELKTAKNAAPRAFQWQGKTLGYREQLSWYDVGLGTIPDPLESRWRENYVVVVGKSKPWPVSIHRVSPLAMQQANARVDEWLDTYQACVASGKWPDWDAEIRDWDADVEYHGDDDDD